METHEIDFTNGKATTNQQGLALLFNVDRASIRNWQNKGLPYIKAEKKGAENRYIVPVALYWYIGRSVAGKRNIQDDLTPIAYVLLGYSSDQCALCRLYQKI